MGWEPITYCPICSEPHDVYFQGPCEGCLELLQIDAEMAQERLIAAQAARAKEKEAHEPR